MKYLLLTVLVQLSISTFAQVDSTTPPYKRFPDLPPLQILLSDSSTIYKKDMLPKKKPVLILLFSPDCSHCQHETEELVSHKDDIKDLQVVMVTLHPLWQMKEFIETYKLATLENVVIGKDIYYTLPSFYAVRNFPFHALYDKKGQLISVFEGSMELKKILDGFNQ